MQEWILWAHCGNDMNIGKDERGAEHSGSELEFFLQEEFS